MAEKNVGPRLGFDLLRCQIENIDGDYATVIDQMGQTKTVLVGMMRAKGVRPKVGERWLIDRQLGHWSLAAVLMPVDRALERFVATSPASPAAWNVVHGLGSEDVGVTVRETASGLVVASAVHVLDESTIQVTLTSSHVPGYFTAVVIG